MLAWIILILLLNGLWEKEIGLILLMARWIMFLVRNSKSGVAGIGDFIEWLLWFGLFVFVVYGIYRVVFGAAG
jgi:hypothetical protein